MLFNMEGDNMVVNKNIWFKSSLFILILVVIVLSYFVFSALYIGGAFSARVTPESAQRDYRKYKEEFNIIADYVSENEINNFNINPDNLDKFIAEGTKEHEAVEKLFDAKYRLIGRSENTLYFQKYATLDCGKGIMHALDGELPYMQFLTDAKEFSDDDWYYYEDDYNKWRQYNAG